MRRAGRARTIGMATLAFAFLACGAVMASEVERQIPVIGDALGSGLTMEISREGARQAATPFLTLTDPTVQRIGDRIAKVTARLASKATSAEETVADAVARIGKDETGREESGRLPATLSSLPPLPGEITIRNVKNFLKGLRASRKEKPVPAVSVPVPELRLGMADTSPR